MRFLQGFWQSVTKPSAKLTDIDERQKASLIAGLLFVYIATLLLATVVLVLFSETMTLPFIMANLILLVAYFSLYALSRSAYYRWAARLFLIAGTLACIGIYLFLDMTIQERPLAYLCLVIIIAGISLSLRETVFFFLSIFILLIVAISVRSDNPQTIFYIPNLFGIVGILTIVFVSVNNSYRRRALESEARYRALMKANSEGILIIDENDAKIMDVNPAIEAILGYTPEELMGHYPIEFIDKEYKSMIRSAWEKRYQGIPIESLALHKNGSKVYVEATLKPYDYLQKNAFVLTLMDVSERKQVEALVIESEKRFRAIFNETSHFIGVLDARGKILELNEQGFEFFGLTPNNSLGKYLWEIQNWAHNESSQKRIQKVIEAVQQGATMRYEVEVRDRNNAPAFLDFTLKPVHDLDGNVAMMIADSRDITAYKIAEEKRVEYERRYDALFTNTADAVFIFTLDGYYITANQRGLDMLGYTLEELVGQPTTISIIPDELPESRHVLKRLLDGDEIDVYERKLHRKNGEIFTVEISVMLVRSVDNEPMYYQSLVRDISERKRMERQQLEVTLEKERAKLLQDFIEKASHYFRTPLANLKTSIYLLPKFLNNDGKRQEYLGVARQELDRLQVLLDDLITMVSLQKTDTEFHLARIPIAQLLSEIRSTQEGRSYYPQFDWEWQILDDEEAIIIGDKAVLARAFLNLLDNATLYTKAGGKISVESRVEDKWLLVAVRDTGMGISEADMPNIFKDFYRGQEAMTMKVSSSGLGLTICKSIIERHQGTIQVESRLGEGSHFRVLLPLYTAWANTPPPFPALEM